jgi:putative FmdB family regulatory protein
VLTSGELDTARPHRLSTTAATPPDRGTLLPTYEYHCPKCDATYDMRQGFDAETTQTCEQCGKGIAKRVLHAPPVVFKGSGWYVTDSKGKSSARTGSHNESDGASADSPSESTESKPAESTAKAEPKAAPATNSDAAAAS